MRSQIVFLATALTSCGALALQLPGVKEVSESVSQVTNAKPAMGNVRAVKDPIAGRYIVVLKDNQNPQAAIGSVLKPLGIKPDLVFNTVLNGFAIKTTPSLAKQLAAMDAVKYVEQDARVKKSVSSWGLDRIDQPKLPLDNSFTPSNDGADVHAYVIDTGIRQQHQEFSGRVGKGYNVAGASPGMWEILGPAGALIEGLLGGGGNDGDTSNPEDCNGHGTHVAGTIAGSSYGIARKATVHAIRVLSCDGSGSTSGVIEGVEWVTENAELPAVVNMSLGGGASSALDQAVAKSIDKGLFYAVAAGNENADACGSSPAREPKAYTVGSSDKQDNRSSFSNKGKCVDIFAPGSDITSAWHTGDRASKTISGTSMASPHVAGVAALYLQNNPKASPSGVMAALDKLTVAKLIKDPAGSPNKLLQIPAGSKKKPAKPVSPPDGGGDDATNPSPTAKPEPSKAPAQPEQPVESDAPEPSATPTATTPPEQPKTELGAVSFYATCAGLNCQFQPASRVSGASYRWDFGDGSSSEEPAPSHFFPSAEDFKVQLEMQTAEGVRSSVFSLEVGTANKPCDLCQAAQGALASGQIITLPSFTLDRERDIVAWLRGKSDSYHRVTLQMQSGNDWNTVGQSIGDDDDQVLMAKNSPAGTYRFRLASDSDGKKFQAWTRVD